MASTIEKETNNSEKVRNNQVKTIQDMLVKANEGKNKFVYIPDKPLKSDMDIDVIKELNQQMENLDLSSIVVTGSDLLMWIINREEIPKDGLASSGFVFTVKQTRVLNC